MVVVAGAKEFRRRRPGSREKLQRTRLDACHTTECEETDASSAASPTGRSGAERVPREPMASIKTVGNYEAGCCRRNKVHAASRARRLRRWGNNWSGGTPPRDEIFVRGGGPLG
eukprot:gene22485-biopygen20738